jgi:hypothetical protein
MKIISSFIGCAPRPQNKRHQGQHHVSAGVGQGGSGVRVADHPGVLELCEHATDASAHHRGGLRMLLDPGRQGHAVVVEPEGALDRSTDGPAELRRASREHEAVDVLRRGRGECAHQPELHQGSVPGRTGQVGHPVDPQAVRRSSDLVGPEHEGLRVESGGERGAATVVEQDGQRGSLEAALDHAPHQPHALQGAEAGALAARGHHLHDPRRLAASVSQRGAGLQHDVGVAAQPVVALVVGVDRGVDGPQPTQDGRVRERGSGQARVETCGPGGGQRPPSCDELAARGDRPVPRTVHRIDETEEIRGLRGHPWDGR